MFKVFVKETSGAVFTDISSVVSRDSIKITDEIQEKVNVAVFAVESLGSLNKAQELKIYDATKLTAVSTKRLLTVDDLFYNVKKFRVGNSIWLNAGDASEEKVTIESINTVSKQIGISSASNTYSVDVLVGVKKFAGHITRISDRNLYQLKNVVYNIEASDYTREFDRKLINDNYESKTALQIIDEFVREVVNVGLTAHFTTASVESGATFTKYRASFKSPSEVMQELADACGEYAWWIDYDKDIHFQSFVSEASPFNLSTASNNFSDLKISTDLSKVKNRQIVLGGLEDSDEKISEFHWGDGAKREWVLRSKFTNLTIAIGTNSSSMATASVLPDFINAEASADYFSNYQMQSVRAAATTSTLATTSLIRFRYNEKIPINVLDEDMASIVAIKNLGFGDGVIEGRAIVDKSIDSRAEAIDKARAELLKYSNALINANFKTEEQGLKAGQTIRISDSYRSISQDFLIQRVVENVYAGDKSVFNVECASTLLGISELIQKLLKSSNKIEANDDIGIDLIKLSREMIELTSSFIVESEEEQSEVVELTSSMSSLLVIPPFLWAETTSTKEATWNLFEWG